MTSWGYFPTNRENKKRIWVYESARPLDRKPIRNRNDAYWSDGEQEAEDAGNHQSVSFYGLLVEER